MEENAIENEIEKPIAVKPETTIEFQNAQNKTIPTNYDDIFVTENSTFDIEILYYKDGDVLVVESVDDDFSNKKDCNVIKATFKFPSQGDVTTIHNSIGSKDSKSIESMTINEFSMLELSRFICLIRKWSIGAEISNKTVMTLSPKIIKAIINKVRAKIGLSGIV